MAPNEEIGPKPDNDIRDTYREYQIFGTTLIIH